MRTASLMGIGNPSGAKDRMVRPLRVCTIKVGFIVDRVLPTTSGGIIDQTGGHTTCFANGLSQSQQVFIIFKLDVVHTHQLPALGSGDFICVVRAQIPRVGIFLFYERAYNCSLFTVGIGQRRYGRTAAARAGTTTKLIHEIQV